MSERNEKNLSVFTVGFMYVGTIVGAGFASGREIWQFFGVFGKDGFYGAVFVGVLFIVVGAMVSSLALNLDTDDYGTIIFPCENRIMRKGMSSFMTWILFVTIVNMSAAAGAMVNQQFGIDNWIGGLLLIIIVCITVMGGIHRVSGVFRRVMPILIAIMLITSITILVCDFPISRIQTSIEPSPLSSEWRLSSILYFSYNLLAVIPIVATASFNGRDRKNSMAGTILGGVILLILLVVIYKSMITDMNLSHISDMPMLSLSKKIGTIANLIYGFILFFAIYSSATGNFYGFSKMLKDDKYKNRKIIFFAAVGFAVGLVGFKNIVAYLFPLLGFCGLIIFCMLVCNFFRVSVKRR